ncbi:MAG: hypothetical protein J1F11_07015 [Oscillospiraceae bacterium]|nr:hypothetical protein [Oscillospiraceae bacterium]
MASADKKISPMLHYWKWNVWSDRKMLIILTILHMLASPAVFFAVIAGIFAGNGIEEPDIYIGIGVATTCAAGFMGIIIGVNSFDCLHKKSVVDMKLSLPMTADKRFIADFLSGLFVYIAPFLAAQVIALLLTGFGLLFMEGRTFIKTSYYGGQGPYVCEFFAEAAPILLKLIFCGILVMLMLYTLTVLITVCCGSKFECIVHAISVNIVIPLTIYMVADSMFYGIYGVDPEYNAVRLIIVTSPFGGILNAAGWAFDGADAMSDYMHPAVWAVLFFLLTAAMGVLAFFLHRKRRAEQVSKPFVFKLVYYIISTGVLFCICSVFYMADSFIPAIITTAVVYMIAEVVTNRGFKHIRSSVIRYIVTVASAFFIVFMAQSTDGFGAMNRVPAGISVASVEISYSGIYDDFDMGYSKGIVLRDRDNIRAVIDAHKTILAEHEEYMKLKEYKRHYYDDVEYSYTLTIKYRLVSGEIIDRSYYNVLTPDVAEILSVIDYTDEYKTQIAEYYREKIYDWKKRSANIIEKSDGYYIDNLDARLRRRIRKGNKPTNDVSDVYVPYLYERGFFDRFAEAYVSDIMAIDESNYSRSDVVNRYSFYTLDDGYINIRIPKSFGNSLRLLEEYGFEIIYETY